jgi:hypothetical protein
MCGSSPVIEELQVDKKPTSWRVITLDYRLSVVSDQLAVPVALGTFRW